MFKITKLIDGTYKVENVQDINKDDGPSIRFDVKDNDVKFMEAQLAESFEDDQTRHILLGMSKFLSGKNWYIKISVDHVSLGNYKPSMTVIPEGMTIVPRVTIEAFELGGEDSPLFIGSVWAYSLRPALLNFDQWLIHKPEGLVHFLR